jgi:dihydropyrimidinase
MRRIRRRERQLEGARFEPGEVQQVVDEPGEAPGADADLVLWDMSNERVIRHKDLHDDCDYSPYEGHVVKAFPVTTISRGETVWDKGWISDRYGRGRFLKQEPHS